MDNRAITDRIKFAIRILEGAVEGQESVDDLIVAKQLISEAINKLKACNNQKKLENWILDKNADE